MATSGIYCGRVSGDTLYSRGLPAYTKKGRAKQSAPPNVPIYRADQKINFKASWTLRRSLANGVPVSDAPHARHAVTLPPPSTSSEDGFTYRLAWLKRL